MKNTQFSVPFAAVAVCTLLLTGCAQQYSKAKKKSIASITATPEQEDMARSLKPHSKQPLTQLGGYLDLANASRLRLDSTPSDTRAQSDYNFAVGRIIEIIENQNLTPWIEPILCQSGGGKPWRLSFTPLDLHPEITPANFEILPADRYDFNGKLVGERMTKPGLGAPLVIVGKDQDYTKLDEFVQGEHIYYGLTAAVRFEGRECEIILRDPLKVETVQLDRHSYPLAADFQAPLALSLAELDLKKKEMSAFFNPSKNADTARLARLQPYDPTKIPVLFIHGLTNSQATWMPMIDSLRGDATIRANYQFWIFTYPTGQPYPIPAATLRSELDKIKGQYPDHKDIVVVGHSMGGMISRLLITDSNMTLWNNAFDKPPSENAGLLRLDGKTSQLMRDLLIFKARPDVSRVIYASASHRGSESATNFLGRLGAKIVGNPVAGDEINDEVVNASRNNIKRIPNSIDVLDPDSPFLKAVDTLKPDPRIPYHSIIGDRGKGGNLDRTKPVSTDGIVPYWSSHLDGAQSELIIPSEHWTILHPDGIAEVNRILHLHLGQN